MNPVDYTQLRHLYINGRWQQPLSATYQTVCNPATEEPIGEAPLGGVADLDAAIVAAREAFDHGPWPTLSIAARIACIKRFRDCLQRRHREVSAVLQAEVGVTQLLLNGPQFQGALEAIDYCLQLAAELKPHSNEVIINPSLLDPNSSGTLGGSLTVYEPYGVVAAISAYNYPLLLNIAKLAPALLAGNCLILKPSPLTPFSALLLGAIADEAEPPAGVFNIVTGAVDVGSALTADPRVDLISFTGSDSVGAAILEQSAKNLKKVHLELGGKSAMIVRHDADIALAAANAAFNFTLHAGQGCALLTRFIVHNSVRAEFVQAVCQLLGQLKVGDPSEPDTVIGPLISAAALSKTEHYVQIGLEGGAKLAFGGSRPAHLSRGFFFTPTLFDDVDNGSLLAQQEVFGPIGAVIGFDSDDEAVALANDSNYGLSGAVFSQDKVTAFKLAQKIRSGDVKINGGTGGLNFSAPFGGYKRSGIGREFGPHWLHEYLLEKAIHYPIG
ncbi:aldehyde dehydrogenase family protein [Gammaproteobacteria bacterium LSUCC0057]|uniref:Aldehyde dehydrogenase family protein n=1 Tax=Gammaproteobacteria bacterium LSUCC0057 TaxID=2559237 RepID=A0A4Y8UJ23_9GAMM|nr:aldehyde dehydrogenase family protein [Gammaproteobacteria bacterium LSUCC0057]